MTKMTEQDARDAMHGFRELHDVEQTGDREAAVRCFSRLIADDPQRRAYLLAACGALTTVDALKQQINVPADSLWVVHPDQTQDNDDDVAALRLLIATMNDDSAMVGDILAAHDATRGPEGVIEVIRALIAMYASAISGVQS